MRNEGYSSLIAQINVYDRIYSRTSTIDPWKLDDEVFKEQKEPVHMNWGWDGRCNGHSPIAHPIVHCALRISH